MTVDSSVLLGLLLLAAELLALAMVGFIVARVALGQSDARMALAHGLVIGLALWGLTVSFVLHLLPGLAGAVVGWGFILGLGVVLAWRSPSALRVPPRTVAGFLGAALALFWVGLASRQLLSIADEKIHVSLASTTRSGLYPPVLSWTPEVPLPYHFGADLLIGLLMPPVGPDLAFTTEILGAFVWTAFVLVVATFLLRHGSVSMLLLVPLMLTAGAWTLIWYAHAPHILQVAVPSGIPGPGIRSSLGDIFWPSVSLPWTWPLEASPPNIWKPPFVLTYALGFIVLERVATTTISNSWRSWPLALVVGFMGLMAEEVALVVLALWAVFASARLLRSRSMHAISAAAVLKASASPLLAVILLAVGGGVLTSMLTGVEGKELWLGWHADAGSRRPLGSFETLPGGVGVIGLGVLPVSLAAVLLARRNDFVLVLAAGSGVFLGAALVLQYDPAGEVTRMDGHARNFALLALLAALGVGLPSLRPYWRYAAIAGIAAFVIWPTIASPTRGMALAVSRGLQISNAQPNEREFDEWIMGRAAIGALRSEQIAAYIRDQTAVDARIFSPHPHAMTASTGRPNASGFPGLIHLFGLTGAEYEDALRFLEPAAFRRLGFGFLHAPADWVERLPDRAQGWLADPQYFELLVHDGEDVLYRIKPAFLRLDPTPAPQSYEALRQAVPDLATVHLPDPAIPLTSIRVASVLPHARILGTLDLQATYSLTKIPTEPLNGRLPDIVVMPRDASFNIGINHFATIWWNRELVAYATRPGISAPIDPPDPSEQHLRIRVTDALSNDGQATFTVTFSDHASGQWTGQDWLLVRVADSRWGLPAEFESDGYTLVGARWFGGQISPGLGPTTHTYRFDAASGQLSVRQDDDEFDVIPESGGRLTPGTFVLAARLRLEYLQAAIIPILQLEISETGSSTFTTFQGERRVSVKACIERLMIATHGATPCRDRANTASQAPFAKA